MERLIRRLEPLPSRRLASSYEQRYSRMCEKGAQPRDPCRPAVAEGVRSAARASVDVTAREEIVDRYAG